MLKSLLFSIIAKNKLLYNFLAYVYRFPRNYWRPRSIVSISFIFEQYNLLKEGKVNFLQIGANDGSSQDDYVKKYVKECEWKGILVEPLPDTFKKLQNNYSQYKSNLIFENVAIGKEIGNGTFYSVGGEKYPNVPTWLCQLSSFNYEVILHHKSVFPDIENYIEEINVQIDTISGLLKRHGISHLDVLQIDTEGYDAEIIRMIDFKVYNPEIIMFENRHLSNKDYRQTLRLLYDKGYKVFSEGPDCIAINSSVKEKIQIETNSWFQR